MYEEFYGLKARAFSKTPDPDFLYLSRTHEEALARLSYAVEEREIVFLTGDIGCGKTTLTRALLDSLGDAYRTVLVLNPRLSPVQLLRTVARRLDIEQPPLRREDLLDAIHAALFRDYERGVLPVLIIDEAQLIPSRATFEEIRLLTNFQLDDTNLVSVVVVGQTDLNRRMRHPSYKPLMQRVGMFYHLGPLPEEEIGPYIDHRLSVAGRRDVLFTPEAVAALYRFSGGVPRIINNLATASLLEGLGAEKNLIDESLVESAARELGLAPKSSPQEKR